LRERLRRGRARFHRDAMHVGLQPGGCSQRNVETCGKVHVSNIEDGDGFCSPGLVWTQQHNRGRWLDNLLIVERDHFQLL
jgi:hypothetical protein